jgi:methionyl-tRNA synthetase
VVALPGFFITTAIDYPSSRPHIGHAYEKICADVIARYKRLKGFDVHFSTGTDEHGMKIQRCAEKAGKTPKQFVDEMVKHFEKLCKVLNISYDDFIRTTEDRHVRVAQEIFRRIFDKGEIYKGNYEGLYCVECETYYTSKDLKDDKCPVHRKEPENVSEESYFFQMGKYQDELLRHMKGNPGFIRPGSKGKEILNRLANPLKDLSVSRTSFEWGIQVPVDKKHIQYVWMDALINYLSTVGWPAGKSKKFWPADIHLIGKDIVWHHTVIWGSILLAAGIKLPKTVYVHGFVNIKGEKMSKSKGVVVDPIELANEYSADALRYFLLSEIPFGEDGDFSIKSLLTRNNDELADTLGNFINRVLTFIYSKSGGKVPQPKDYDELDKQLLENLKVYTDNVGKLMDDLELNEALDQVMLLAKFGNEYFQAKEPWANDSTNCLYLGANLVRSLAILLEPFIPASSEKIWGFLNQKASVHEQSWESAKDVAVKPGHSINKPAPLFSKFKIE